MTKRKEKYEREGGGRERDKEIGGERKRERDKERGGKRKRGRERERERERE
jgi:hypothetical protein